LWGFFFILFYFFFFKKKIFALLDIGKGEGKRDKGSFCSQEGERWINMCWGSVILGKA
jgi:hypothetical protein